MKQSDKIKIELLENALKSVQEELNEAHDYLNTMKVPTNGVDANGNLGHGKREELTLKQRLTYVQYSKNTCKCRR